jgi:phosphinothricin acetyltransferase
LHRPTSSEDPGIAVRPARHGDADAIARIYAQAIEDRVATFRTHPLGADEFASRIEAGDLTLVAELSGDVVAWATVGAYEDPHEYYAGVGEATLYVERGARRAGVGRTLLDALAAEAERRGYYKLIGKIFTTNAPSIALVGACRWREVGTYRRHGRLDGEWKDVLVVERLLGDAAE